MEAPKEQKEKQLTKKELRILKRQQQAIEEARSAKNALDPSKFGLTSQMEPKITGKRRWTNVGEIDTSKKDNVIWIRAYLQNVRAKSKIAFLLLRQTTYSIQAVLSHGEQVSKEMVKFAGAIPKESVVEVMATVTLPHSPVKSTTQQNVELVVHKIFINTKALPELPFQIEDASRSEKLLKEEGSSFVSVGMDTRLNNRFLDLRTPAMCATMKIQAAVKKIFADFLTDRGFVWITTPKILPGASEGGSNCFTFDYFGREACLAQSPQLYKQMACACSGLERVFEIGPVFRAENSNTHRHLCEFNGLDFEMVIKDHYHEVLEVFSDLFIHIFDTLNSEFKDELAAINEQYPFEPLKYLRPTLRITYEEGVTLLRAAGASQEYDEDLSTENEKWLGRIIREKYETDFYILDKFPLAVRPFYTMPDPEDKRWSNSYDLMIRGEEIVSGAQRVHNAEMLQERITEMGMDIGPLQDYVDSFKCGALPHGGGGIGLERVVMLFLNLGNIRKASMFPRDPTRLTP